MAEEHGADPPAELAAAVAAAAARQGPKNLIQQHQVGVTRASNLGWQGLGEYNSAAAGMCGLLHWS
jgi:hypothetical protein